MKSPRKYLFVIAAIAVAAAVTACGLFLFFRRARQADLRYLQQAEYTSVFFSMVPYRDMAEDAIGEDFFSYFFGIKAATVSGWLRNANDLNEYLKTALDSGNEVSLVNLELVPFRLGSFSGLGNLITAHPDTIFQILLDAPVMSYWTSQSDGRVKKQLAAYRDLAEGLLAYSNVELYFVGAEDWLILNPGNYTAPLVANKDIAKHLALLTLCDDRYRLTTDNYIAVFTWLKDKIDLARTVPASADLSDWCLVFFGDSVIGNYTDSNSIPGATAALSGCEAYNLGIGGTPARVEGPGLYSFPVIVDSFLKREAVTTREGVICPQEMAAYYENGHDGKQMCFVVNYGLNDYFGGAPVDNPEDPFDTTTYAGALRSGIRELRTAFPESVIVLAAPNYTEFFSHGQDRLSDVGGTLTDYVEAAGRVAQDTNAVFMDNYHDLGIDESNSEYYLADGCHPGDNGRFLYAQALVRLVQHNCIEAKLPREDF